jgi:isoquinoline 1-oxidoreductase beta subunit
MENRGSRLRAAERLAVSAVLPAKANRGTSRRAFLKITAVSAGGLVLGVRFAPAAQEVSGEFRPNAWVRIDPSGKVTLTVDKSEMGQGVRTSLPMILAEELEVDVDTVELFQASPGPEFQDMGTYGSRSTRTLWTTLRTAGAAAREMLVAAAAAQWGVAPSACRAEGGRVLHVGSSRSLGYGELASAAGRLPVPSAPALKPRSQWRLIGKDRRRVDAPRIVAGEPLFASDVQRPGMKFASVVRCPVVGGKAKSWDESKAKAVPGFRMIAPVTAGLAVIADDTYAVLSAREVLEPTIVWDEGANAATGSPQLLATLRGAFDSAGTPLRRGGNVAEALASSARTIKAEYFYPYQVHAPLETMSAVAEVQNGRCEIWAGSQAPNRVQADTAKLLGIPESAVTVHVPFRGGGFGRRGRTDFVRDAVDSSRAAGAPVRVVWTRSDDMRNGDFHPISLHRLSAGLDAAGRPSAWRHRVSVGVFTRMAKPEAEQVRAGLRGAYDMPYAIGSVEAELIESASPVRTASWRAVNHNHNVFASECFFDELATAAGKDPVALRLELLRKEAAVAGGRAGEPVERDRLAATLALAAEKARWTRTPKLPAGRGKGAACASYDGRTPAAVIAEVTVGRDGEWRVDRIVCAIDCGVAVNPLGIRAQVEGSVAWAVSALSSEITLEKGRVVQANYRDFPILRYADMPKVETHIVQSDAPPTGSGEPPVPITAAAVANALSAATGRRVRRLPVRAEDLKGA